MSKRRLGRGLDSLISAPASTAPAAQPAPAEREDAAVAQIPVARIELNPSQPRQALDPDSLASLADSIRQAGVLQPVLLRPKGEMYELVAGERRLRAAHMAGLAEVPALVRDVPDERMLELALIENIQREDLNPIEKARAVGQLIASIELTQEETGQKLGMDRSSVANLLRLLELPGEVQDMVSRGTLSAGHARAILGAPEGPARLALARRVLRDGLSVRQTERLVAGASGRSRTRAERSPQLRHLEQLLQESLGARVEIRSRGAKGTLLIHFQGHEDFERLLERLTSPG